MAHHVLGVDLGAYSVKVCVVNPGFRHPAAVDFIERLVPPGEEPHDVRAARVLGQILRERKLEGDLAYAAASGDQIFIHVLELPFRNLRRAELEKAVGAELEGILPIDLEDMVFGFDSLPANLADEPAAIGPGGPGGGPAELGPALAQGRQAAGDDDPTDVRWALPPGQAQPGAVAGAPAHGRVAAPTTGMRILACAMEKSRARQLIETLGEHAAEPRGLVAAPASYARVVERMARFHGDKTSGQSAGPVAVIDIGHRRTDICVIKDGRAVYARTISRGGHHLTEVISRAWRISYDEAQSAKHADGFVASLAEPADSAQWRRVHDVVVTEIGPLAADLRRTFSSCRAKTGASVAQAVLVGGGSRLRGLASFLSEKLHIPVTTLGGADAAEVFSADAAKTGVDLDLACLAAGVAFEGVTGRPHFDLRQGELAYKADLSFLRQKATTFAAVLLVIVGFAVVNGFAAHYRLRADERALSQRLALETTEAFGETLSASDALDRAQGQGGGKKSPLPKMTAYDVLLEINNHLPDRKAVELDVRDLDIKSGKITMKATAHSAQEIDQVEESLKKVECFKISRGNTSVGANDEHEFSFSITSTCM